MNEQKILLPVKPPIQKIPVGWLWIGNLTFGLAGLMVLCWLLPTWAGGILLILWALVFPISLFLRIGQEIGSMLGVVKYD